MAAAAGAAFEVLAPGTQTTVQDLPGRLGYWGVGVPPSGAWDDLSFALANRAVGNPRGAAGLEAVLRGPVLRVRRPVLLCVTGAATAATLDRTPLTPGRPVAAFAGQTLDLGPMRGPGLRGYVAVSGGLAVPSVLDSRSTFLLGGFGGYHGRPLRTGDLLDCGEPTGDPVDVRGALPVLTDSWTVRVVPGPHGAPEYFTEEGVEALFDTQWRLDHRSDRTGVRLVGPPGGLDLWSRADGGEAGLHPSNIHDSAYPVGGVMISGGTPVIVGPDGPSLGGFVVPATVIQADRWRLAQCRPGDRLRLLPVTPQQAEWAASERERMLAGERPVAERRASYGRAPATRPAPLLDLPADADRPALVARRAGDHHLLVEVGPARLDLAVRLRVHLLSQALGEPDGLVDRVEGVRSLLLSAGSPAALPALADAVGRAWDQLPELSTVEIPAREVTLPIAFDDPAAHEAMSRYRNGVRWDAPWCPDNVEFIRRINGLAERGEVFDIMAKATYLVVGLGDVYLGAPVAVPLDPAHRLVTTKYDPPRTWTPANAVGIGGAYLCVYGMEGPGGYQLVGRTVPVWRLAADPPWLLRQFDLLRFRPVTPDELLALRADLSAGRIGLDTRPATLRLADLLPAADPDTVGFTRRRQAAFAAERDRWAAAAGVPASPEAGQPVAEVPA
jgi:urea carboxylase